MNIEKQLSTTNLNLKRQNIILELIDKLKIKTDELINFHNSNHLDLFNAEFVTLLDLSNLFVVKIFDYLNENEQITRESQNAKLHLLSTCKSLLRAKEKNDLLMICDLLEYEFMDNLTEWKQLFTS